MAFKFDYKKRSFEDANDRAQMGSGAYDKFTVDGIKMWKPKNGNNLIRILPPTWDEPKHYGYDVFVHNGIGPDKSAYLCLEKMHVDKCPICEARAEARDEDEKNALRHNRRVAVWIIDRDDEQLGAQLWLMPWSVDRDISSRTLNKRTARLLMIDDPNDGYDIEFTKEGEGLKTKYVGIDVARDATPVLDDEDEGQKVLEYISEKSIPSVLKFYEYSYIKNVFNSGNPEAVKKPVKSRKPVAPEEDEESFDDIDSLLAGKPAKKVVTEKVVEQPVGKKTTKVVVEDEEGDEDVILDEEEDIEVEEPASPAKTVKSVTKVEVELDEDEDDFDIPSVKSRLAERVVKPAETVKRRRA